MNKHSVERGVSGMTRCMWFPRAALSVSRAAVTFPRPAVAIGRQRHAAAAARKSVGRSLV